MDERKGQKGQQTPHRPSGRGKRSAGKKQGLPPEIQNQIGRQLRNLYIDVVQEGVPDRFTELLRRLDDQGSSKESKS
jgi:Anti-sigma factor NepR